MIVHNLRERQQRRRQKRDQEPYQTETDYVRLLENSSHDRADRKKNHEHEARPEARIISCCKRIEVVVGGESSRPEEGLNVLKDHIRLRDQVIVRVRGAGDPGVRRHVLHQEQHRAADQERRADSRKINERAAPDSAARDCFGREEQTVDSEQYGEDRRGRFG